MLTANSILRLVREKRIVIEPFNPDHLNPNSYNLTLAPKLLWYPGKAPLDLKSRRDPSTIFVPEHGLVLQPNELYLGCSNEYTESHDHIPMINGRSSLARLGVSVHQTGGFGDIGFKGNWTLEITVIKPVKIYPDIQFAQLCWFRPDGLVDQLYQGKYQNSRTANPIESRLHRETLKKHYNPSLKEFEDDPRTADT